MLRKSTLLAVAASAALGLAMLAPTAASAHGGHGGGGGHWGGAAMAAAGAGTAAIITGITAIAARSGTRGLSSTRWPGPVAVSSPAPCTCLSKEYTPEGSVVFKDRCTNEMAMNPPVQPAPQQTGQLEQQYQQQ